MQIHLSNGSLQCRNFSGTGSIGGIPLPDFHDEYVYSKKKSSTSESAYKQQIAEQAYQDFAKGQFQNQSEGFRRLMKRYTSIELDCVSRPQGNYQFWLKGCFKKQSKSAQTDRFDTNAA